MKWCARRLQWRRGHLAGAVLNTGIDVAVDAMRNCRRSRPYADGEIAGPLREMMAVLELTHNAIHSSFLCLQQGLVLAETNALPFCVFLQPTRVPRKLGAPRNQDQHRLRPVKRALSDELRAGLTGSAREAEKPTKLGNPATQPWEDGASRATSSAGAPASEKMPRQLEVPAHVSLRQSTVGTAGRGLGTNKHQVPGTPAPMEAHDPVHRHSPIPEIPAVFQGSLQLAAWRARSTLEASRKPPRNPSSSKF